MVKKIKTGSIFELKLPKGVVCLHYLGKHPEYGEAVVVSSIVTAGSNNDYKSIFKNGYTVFYPVKAACSKGLISLVDELPAMELPKVLRRPGARVGTHVKTWIIETSNGESVIRETLSDDERKLPLGVIWNHEMLIQRVLEGWRPEVEK